MTRARPTEAVFADGAKKSAPLALHPDAIGVSYPVRDPDDNVSRIDGIAVVTIEGPLAHKGGDWWSWWDSYESIVSRFQTAIESDKTTAVILKFDSPGGECAGCFEAVKAMQALKAASGKPVYAFSDEACYSAAYALAMVADEIVLPESAGCGSVGVITVMAEMSERDKRDGFRFEVIASGSKKADGHPHIPMTDGAIKRTQRRVDGLAAQFFAMVGEGRKMSPADVKGLQAGVFFGAGAVAAGLADGVMSFEELLTTIRISLKVNSVSGQTSTSERASTSTPEAKSMSAVMTALRKLNEANEALTAAKTDAERAKCAAAVLAAEAKYKAEKKAKAKDDAKCDSKDDDDDDKADDDADSDADEEEDDDDDESTCGTDCTETTDAGKDDDAKTGLHTKDRLLRLTRQITGKRSIEEVMGALHGMWQANKRNAGLASKVAKLESARVADKLAALVKVGCKAGKIAPNQVKWARTQTVASLQAYLDVTPAMVHAADGEHTEAAVNGSPVGSVTAEMAKIWKKQGFAEKDFPALLAKMNGKPAPMANGAN